MIVAPMDPFQKEEIENGEKRIAVLRWVFWSVLIVVVGLLIWFLR